MRRALAAMVAILPAALPAAAPADDVVAQVTRATPVNAFGGRLAWSEYDAALGRFRLTTRSAGIVAAVPVRTRAVPFDVDLGPDGAGGVVAVYSRCRREPGRQRLGNALVAHPGWSTGRGCRLWRFDFSTGRESRIEGTAARDASEFAPAIWKDRVAFARRYPRRPALAGDRPLLFVKRLSADARARRLPGGPHSRYRVCIGGNCHRERFVAEPGPTAMDLRGWNLAVAWDSGSEVGPTSSLLLETIGRRVARRRLQRVESGSLQGSELVTPALDGSALYWGSITFGDSTGSELRRFALPGGPAEAAALPAASQADEWIRPVLGVAVDGGAVAYLISGAPAQPEPGCTPRQRCVVDPGCAPDRPCEIRLARDLAFTRARGG